MRYAAVLGCVLVLVVGVALAVTGEAKPMKANGKVVSVDVTGSVLTVAVAGSPGSPREVTFEVGPETTITKASKQITLAEVKNGDQASVTYNVVEGKNMAVTVGVESKPA